MFGLRPSGCTHRVGGNRHERLAEIREPSSSTSRAPICAKANHPPLRRIGVRIDLGHRADNVHRRGRRRVLRARFRDDNPNHRGTRSEHPRSRRARDAAELMRVK